MDQFVIPPGRATGCLPRKWGFGAVCAPMADKIQVISRAKWSELIGEVNLRPHVRQILDQDGVGSCATESTSQSVMVAEALAGQEFTLLNPWFIYHTTSGGSDRGSSIDENLEFAREKGIAPEAVWPRSKGWKATPSQEAIEAAKHHRIVEFFDIASVEEFGTALLLGFPVVFGWSGHSVMATRLLSDTKFEYANSWAESWGDQGFGQLELAKINWGYGAFAVRTSTEVAA